MAIHDKINRHLFASQLITSSPQIMNITITPSEIAETTQNIYTASQERKLDTNWETLEINYNLEVLLIFFDKQKADSAFEEIIEYSDSQDSIFASGRDDITDPSHLHQLISNFYNNAIDNNQESICRIIVKSNAIVEQILFYQDINRGNQAYLDLQSSHPCLNVEIDCISTVTTNESQPLTLLK